MTPQERSAKLKQVTRDIEARNHAAGLHTYVATCESCNADRDAAPPAGPSIDEKVEELERILQPRGRCVVCGGGEFYWKHDGGDGHHEFAPPPDPVAGLREAAESAIRLLSVIHLSADVEQADMQAGVAVETLRAALLDEPVPLDAASLREYIVANMHDGDDSGVMTAPTRSYVDETVEVVMEWIATRLTLARNREVGQ